MKIKLPKIFTPKKKKLRATAVRKPLRIAATADYEEMAEPNMKLSRALLIVLVLHVVAVSGIIAFNAIKTRQVPSLASSSPPAAPAAPSSTAARPEPATHVAFSQVHTDSKAAHSPAVRPASKEEHKNGKAAGANDSGKVYVVAKGDNPVNIAKKLKVSYDELLAINHIDNPHKLQIGQKLIIPKPPKAKKVEP